jgi:Tfp pilus assembly protein FimT
MIVNSWRFKRLLAGTRGFTVSQMLAALTVMAGVFAIGVPRYVAFQPGMQLNGAAREILVKLMWARSKAVEQNNQWVVTLPTNQTLRILDDKNNNGTADSGEWTQTINVSTDYPGVTFSKSGSDPTFSAGGTAGGSTTITISNTSGSRTVTVNGTGNVKIN